ncbi:MAG: TolC family protein [Planctomycetaceae bacterium]
MKYSCILSSTLVSASIVGCASPPALSGLPYLSTRAKVASTLAHPQVPPDVTSQKSGMFGETGSISTKDDSAKLALVDAPAVTAVAYHAQEQSAGTQPSARADQAITPQRPYSSESTRRGDRAGSPVEAGNVFIPAPEIPRAPSLSWPPQRSMSDATALTLADVEALACQGNPTLLQARAQVQGAIGKAIQAGLWPNPTLIYSAEQIGVAGTAGEFHGGLVRQRIVTAHKLDLSRAKYLARTRTAEWVALAQQYRVLNDIRLHYFRTRGRQELVAVQQELLKNSEDSVVTFGEMHNVGQATRAEVHQANVRLQQQRLKVLMAENDFRQSAEELMALAGADVPASTFATPLAGPLAVIDWDEAIYRLLEESPQIAAARSKLEADRIAIRREIAEPVPDIIVQGGAGYNFEAGETVGAAQVMMEVPVFDWNQGTIRQAEADYARQTGELRRTELSLRQQLAQQYRNYLTAVQHVQNYEQVVLPEAKAAYDLRLQSYEVDRAPWTDVLAAEQDFFMHRAQYINNLIVWRENEVSIMGFLLHGGLSDPPNPTPPGHIDAVAQPR